MPFAKGQSGNPGGRPRAEGRIKELAQDHGERAIARLAELMDDEDKRVSVAACQALLDRGYGKPSQSLEMSSDPEKPFSITVNTAATLLSKLRKPE